MSSPPFPGQDPPTPLPEGRSSAPALHQGSSAPLPLWAPAPAKINLGLFVGPLRQDGRHELVTVMQSISLADELTLNWAPAGAAADELICPGVPGPPEENLAMRALAAFRRASGWDAPPLRLQILKRVPIQAGLGGGSGDAAAALRLAALASGLGDEELLRRVACELGADVPAQIRPGRWLARGSGELLHALPDPDPPLGVLVLEAPSGLSTAEVYAHADELTPPRTRDELRSIADSIAAVFSSTTQPPSEPAGELPQMSLLANDLQAAAISICPSIEENLMHARAQGASAAFLSGSGSASVGLFAGPDGPLQARSAAHALAALRPAPIACRSVGASFAFARPASASQ